MSSVAQVDDPVIVWPVAALEQAFPGTCKRWWHRVGVPLLVESGAVRRVGRRVVGRRSAIEHALTTAPKVRATRGRVP
jgi:hypothetical protein